MLADNREQKYSCRDMMIIFSVRWELCAEGKRGSSVIQCKVLMWELFVVMVRCRTLNVVLSRKEMGLHGCLQEFGD